MLNSQAQAEKVQLLTNLRASWLANLDKIFLWCIC
jgi:hypothetical protein